VVRVPDDGQTAIRRSRDVNGVCLTVAVLVPLMSRSRNAHL
jgi:hypothetical protein